DWNDLLHFLHLGRNIFRACNERFLTGLGFDMTKQQRDVALQKSAEPAVTAKIATTFQSEARTNALEINIDTCVDIESRVLWVIDEIIAVPSALGHPDAARPGDVPRWARRSAAVAATAAITATAGIAAARATAAAKRNGFAPVQIPRIHVNLRMNGAGLTIVPVKRINIKRED